MSDESGHDQDFQSLVEAATDAIMVVAGTGDILYANDAAGALFGLAPADLCGLHFGHPMVHGQTVEVDVPTPDRLRVAEMRVSSLEWEGKNAFVTILRDVTERNALTAHLRDRLRFEELLLEVSSVFAAAGFSDESHACDKALVLLGEYLNVDHLCLITAEVQGYRIVGCHPGPCNVCAPVIHADLIRLLDICLASRQVCTVRRSGGMTGDGGAVGTDRVGRQASVDGLGRRLMDMVSAAWIGIMPLRMGGESFGALCLYRRTPPPPGSPLEDLAQVRPVEAVLVDSLRRMRAENLLNTAVAKQAAVFQQAMEGLALVRGQRIQRVNHATAKMFGYTPEEMVGMEVRQLFASPEAFDGIGLSGYGLMSRGRVYTAEHLFQRRNGERFWAEIKGSYVDPAVDDPEAVWVLRDISDQREDARRKEQLIEELRRSNAELERFAFITSHDLKEPVRMVASYVNLLSKRYGNSLDHEGLEFMAYALEGAKRIHAMVEGILEYARIDKAAKDITDVNLNDVLTRALDDLTDTIRESQARIEADPLPVLPAVPSEMERVFTNLISNAIKFAKPNSAPVIRISAKRTGADDPLWHLAISDNGIGVSPKDREKVFELFSRLHGRDQFDGNGLGLAIVKRIVERRGGRIWLESEEGIGTTVHMQFPAAG